jgi:LuxR family transcriptional regulator, quorum-sensing system regulator SdiA
MSYTRELNDLLGELQANSPGGYAVGLHIRFAAPLITAHTYPEEWLRIYTSRAYALRDPLIFWGLSCEGTTRWSEIELPDPFDIFGQARGVRAELRMRRSLRAADLAHDRRGGPRRSRVLEDAEIARIQAIVWKMHEIAEPPEELTKAQVEALKCIADGDRHIAAAARLGISESALKARLTAAREKLSARTTSEAIQRAKDFRLI